MSTNDMLAMLLDQAGRLFGDSISRALLVAAEEGIWPAALWQMVDGFGLPDALVISAEEGGLGYADASALFTLLGRHAVPLPLGETILARGLLARTGLFCPDGPIGLAAESPVRDGAGYSGSLGSVDHAAALSHVVASVDGGTMLAIFSVVDAKLTPNLSISGCGRGLVGIETVVPIAMTGWPDSLPDSASLGAMLRASQMAGAIDRLLALSIDYANTRRQFGRPIARFQAVQQLLAVLAGEAAAAQASADGAWAALDRRALGAAGMIAKIRTGEAARLAAAIAHQVHGAIGVTDEHMLHYYTRRLWEWRLDFGSDGLWAKRLGEKVIAGGDVWTFLTAEAVAPHYGPAEELTAC